jgi:hypothetical protein
MDREIVGGGTYPVGMDHEASDDDLRFLADVFLMALRSVDPSAGEGTKEEAEIRALIAPGAESIWDHNYLARAVEVSNYAVGWNDSTESRRAVGDEDIAYVAFVPSTENSVFVNAPPTPVVIGDVDHMFAALARTVITLVYRHDHKQWFFWSLGDQADPARVVRG